uniref:Mos1 transposase HTH domain-containing protein n=1 Tax=Phlebotomus papatasi TaxID=29031 RepID=A0A1B0D2H1_PHLPP
MKKKKKSTNSESPVPSVSSVSLDFFFFIGGYPRALSLLSLRQMENSDLRAAKVHYRHCLLHLYYSGVIAPEACKIICDTYGKDSVNVRTCRRWFCKFEKGNFDLRDRIREGRPHEIEDKVLEDIMQRNPPTPLWKMAKELGCIEPPGHGHIGHSQLLAKLSSCLCWILFQQCLQFMILNLLRSSSAFLVFQIKIPFLESLEPPPASIIIHSILPINILDNSSSFSSS